MFSVSLADLIHSRVDRGKALDVQSMLTMVQLLSTSTTLGLKRPKPSLSYLCVHFNSGGASICDEEPCQQEHLCFLCLSDEHGSLQTGSDGQWLCPHMHNIDVYRQQQGLSWSDMVDSVYKMPNLLLTKPVPASPKEIFPKQPPVVCARSFLLFHFLTRHPSLAHEPLRLTGRGRHPKLLDDAINLGWLEQLFPSVPVYMTTHKGFMMLQDAAVQTKLGALFVCSFKTSHSVKNEALLFEGLRADVGDERARVYINDAFCTRALVRVGTTIAVNHSVFHQLNQYRIASSLRLL